MKIYNQIKNHGEEVIPIFHQIGNNPPYFGKMEYLIFYKTKQIK